MANTNATTTSPILNPNVYLNYLPHKTAVEFEVARNVYLATAGALIWDMLSSLPEDVRLVVEGKFTLTKVAYFLSRASSLAYVLLSVVAKTHTVAHCNALELAVGICWVFAVSSSSFLFLRRVQALFASSRTITHIFTLLWLANAGISIVTPVGIHSGPLAQTGYCINKGVEHYASSTLIMSFIFDTLVFLAISWKVVTSQAHDGIPGYSFKLNERATWKTLLSGKSLPRLSRALLQGGQQYYLITVGANILVLVLILTPSVPPVYEATFTIPELALQSSMACRVFRNLKFKVLDQNTVLSTVKFGPGSDAPTGGNGDSGASHGYGTRQSISARTQEGPLSGKNNRHVLQVRTRTNVEAQNLGLNFNGEDRSSTAGSRATQTSSKFATADSLTPDLEKGLTTVAVEDLPLDSMLDGISLEEMNFVQGIPGRARK